MVQLQKDLMNFDTVFCYEQFQIFFITGSEGMPCGRKDWQWNYFDVVIVSVQVFEEVSTLLGDDHQGEIQLSTSSSAIRIIRTQHGKLFSRCGACLAVPFCCGGFEVPAVADPANRSTAALHPGSSLRDMCRGLLWSMVELCITVRITGASIYAVLDFFYSSSSWMDYGVPRLVALFPGCLPEPQLAFEASGNDHIRGGSFLRTVACLHSIAAQRAAPCCLHVVLQLTGRFIIDAGALNKELMLQHPELQFYFSDLSRRLPEASVVVGCCRLHVRYIAGVILMVGNVHKKTSKEQYRLLISVPKAT